uniref:Uncharacterized protein n=1 Tax=Ditylum brightwellii TaxID=49249 RepID=A0A7S4WHY5_9STRA
MGKKNRPSSDSDKSTRPQKRSSSLQNDTEPHKQNQITSANDNKTDSSRCESQQQPTSNSPSALIKARVKRATASSLKDLEDVQQMLKDILSSAEEGSEEWTDAGNFLATLLLQIKVDSSSSCDESGTKTNNRHTVSQLLDERGFSYHLSRKALTHSHDTVRNPPHIYANAWDNALPSDLLQKLGEAFGPNSSFWTSHNYSDGSSGKPPSPYFSYVVPLQNEHENDDTAKANQSVLMQIIRKIQQQISINFPDVLNCTAAEWWSHCRPHCSGHQLHFDSDDEGRGGVRNPVASTVTYLSCDDTSVGGETLVTSQSSVSKKLATKGWLCSNKRNRVLAFKGNLLHGVIPGAGAQSSHKEGKRVTFMVAFWKRIHVQDKEGFGSARPFSRVENEEWAKPLVEKMVSSPGSSANKGGEGGKRCENCFFEVPVWEDVDKEKNQEYGMAIQNVTRSRVLPPYDAFFQFFS